jgi:hypothetical protein
MLIDGRTAETVKQLCFLSHMAGMSFDSMNFA